MENNLINYWESKNKISIEIKLAFIEKFWSSKKLNIAQNLIALTTTKITHQIDLNRNMVMLETNLVDKAQDFAK